ncbi:unnamed protein product [Phaedon cochleariae]|uniref:Peptidase S1 domain-containing protein n=1 Tax=Phaedon cochleariae TaxID=80249 RepID=A0A9P0DG25_PHACE|nr:unnamed protein product [Phaedon cochleariae]
MLEKVTQVFIFFTICFTAIAQVNDRCFERHSNSQGICKLITDCPAAVELAKIGVETTLCGFYQLTEPIVCCVEIGLQAQPNVDGTDFIFPSEANSENLSKQNNSSNVVPNDNLFSNEADLVFPDNLSIDGESFNADNSENLRISDQKCEEYTRPVTSVVQVIPLVTNTKPINITVPKCEYNGVPLIVGGKPASPGEFPFMAAIGFNTTEEPWRCGGTLISDRYVLTAGHCTFTRDAGSPAIIRLGGLDLSNDNDGSEHQTYLVSRVTTHPEYRYPLKYNDIALLRTHKRVRFTAFVRPACLYTKSHIEFQAGIATGWGRTDFAGENSDKLMKVTLNIYNNQQCYRTYQNNKDLPSGITSNMICAGELKGGRDTCQGDSGGPLIVTRPGNQCSFYVVGVTSFGKSCGQRNTPAIYTRVSEYVTWIEQTIW